MNNSDLRLLVTIDTECDKSATWRTASPLSFRAVTEAIPNRLQPLFADQGIRPTYLLSPEVILQPGCVSALRELKNTELTTHLHGDYIVPEPKTWELAGSLTDEMQWEYGPDLERAKLAALTELFRQQFGFQPLSFRAGRFGAGPHTCAILRDLGYVIDSSVTPHICWTSRLGEKRPDYRGYSERPYTLGSEGDIARPGGSSFLELPVTILPAGTLPSSSPGKPIWFRPWYSDAETMCRVLEYVAGQPPEHGIRRPLVMMFHNVELVAGASPYPQSEVEVVRYLDMLKRVFERAEQLGIRACTMAEYHNHFMKSAENTPSKTRLAPEVGATVATRRTFRPELNLPVATVESVLKEYEAPGWFSYVFRERAARWDTWKPCAWAAENLPPSTPVLSLGCGFGLNLFWLAEQGFTDLHGCDLDHRVVGAGNELAVRTGLPVRLWRDDAITPRHLPAKRYGLIEALNWAHLVEGFSLDALLDRYLPHLTDDGVFLLDIIDDAYNAVPGNEYCTQDRKKPVAERRPSEYRVRHSRAQVAKAFAQHGMTLVATIQEPQQIPKVVYIARRGVNRAGQQNTVDTSLASTPTLDRKPRILLIADVPNWIFARHCQVIREGVSDEFDFDVTFRGQSYDEDAYDLVYPLEFNLIDPARIRNQSKYVTGIRSHSSWAKQDFNELLGTLQRRFQRVHVVSKRLLDVFAPGLSNVDYVTHGVNAEFFTSRKPVSNRAGVLRVGWAGNRKNSTKGFAQFIEPLGRLPGVELVFCGYSDRNLDREAMREFYDSIDVYVCTSLTEGNNNSLLEAAAMERAIVTTDVGTVPEYLHHEQSALIVERSLDSISAAIERLRVDPELRLRLGRSARQSVIARFELGARLESFRGWFRAALARASTPEAGHAPGAVAVPVSLAQHLAAGQEAIQRGDVAGAIRELTVAATLAPRDGDLRVALGNLHTIDGQVDAARSCFAQALEIDPRHPEAHEALRLLAAQSAPADETTPSPGNLQEAERQARAALAIDPNGVEALRLLASICLQSDRWPEAAQAAARLLEQKPDDIEALLMLAKCFFKTGDQESTRLALERVLEFDPDHELARENLTALGFPPAPGPNPAQQLAGLIQAGQEAIARGDALSAIRSLEQAVILNPKDADLLVAVAGLHLAVGEVEPARRHLAQAVLHVPDHTEARKLLLELALGEPVSAETAEASKPEGRHSCCPSARRAEATRGDRNVAFPAEKDNAVAFAELQRGFELLKARNFAEAEFACLNYQGLIDYDALERTDNRTEANPQVSVVIVAYNINDGLIQCLDSIAAAQNPPHEIIVVDNGGNEAIHAELARRPILHVRVGFNVILAEGRNLGIHFARAPIAAFIDDDALAGPHYLASVVAAFETFDIHAFRGCVLPKTDHPNNGDVKHYDLGSLPLPCFNNTEGNSATRVNTWRQFGGQDPLLFGSEGIELSYRMARELGSAATIYWPWTTIRHDYAVTDAKKETKNSRHKLMREYAEWKHSGLAETYRQVRRNYMSELDRARLAVELAAGAGKELPALLACLEQKFSARNGAGAVASPVEALRAALAQHGWQARFDAYAAQLRRIEIVRPVVKPDLSVVIIAHEIRPDCLKVLQKLRAETGSHYEIIYVTNGSGVANIAEVRPLVDTVIELRTNTGAYFARNVGAAFAASPILFFLDDDAIPEQGLIAAHLDAFKKYDAISVRGAIVGKTNNPLNALAKHYHLGPKPFPVQADVEGNTSYRAEAFFAVGGWDDEINFGGGGIDLAFRLLSFDADRRRQIYSPDPVVHHDYAKDQQHLASKYKKQEESRERLRRKHPRFDALRDSWRTFFGRSELLIVREPRDDWQPPVPAVAAAQPLITVAIPTYNRARFLGEAIDSALRQNHPGFEVLVVDDGSTDDTSAVLARVSDPRVRYVRKEHSGGPATRNRCVAEARGEYLLWLDSDDVLLPGMLARYADAVARHPDVDVHYGNLLAADEKLRVCEHWVYQDYHGWTATLLSDLLVENRIPNGGTLIRRACFAKAGGFDAAFTRAHDYEFWTRLAPVATFRHVDATVAVYRRHEDSLTKVARQVDTSFEARIVKRMLEGHALRDLFPFCFAGDAAPVRGEARAWLLATLLMVKYGDVAAALEFARRSVACADLGLNAQVSGILHVVNGRAKTLSGTKAVDEFGRLVEQAAKHFAAGQVQPCAQACAKLTELRPEAVETLLLVGLSLRRWANPNDAKTAFHCLVQRQCESAHVEAVTEAEHLRGGSAETHPLATRLASVLQENSIPNEAVANTLAFIAELAAATSPRQALANRLAGQTPLFFALLGLTDEELASCVDASVIEQLRRVRAVLEPAQDSAPVSARRPGYSFCIITGGQRPDKVARQIASIHALKLSAYEILVGGEVSDVPHDVVTVDLADAARMGQLGKMRNELARRAAFDHLVVCDDDLVFDQDFAAGLTRFGDGYDAMAVRIVNPDGSRFWDWATTGGTKGSVLLDYWDADPNIYITGGFCILKSRVFDRVQWDAHRGFYEREDVDFSTRLKAAGFTIRYNPFCTVRHDDDRYSRVGRRIYRFDHLLEAISQAHRAGEGDEVRRLFPHAIRIAGDHADRKQTLQVIARQMNRPELLAEPLVAGSSAVKLPAGPSAPAPAANGKLEINWQGSFLDYGSLSNINRVLTDALVIQNGASIRRLQTAPVNGKLAKPLQSYRGKLAAKPNPNAALTVRHAWPPDWSRPASGQLAVIQPWEFGSLPKAWVDAARNIDAFWVPSNYVRQVYVDSGVPAAKVHVLPNGIDPRVFTPAAKPLKLATKKAFKFLFVGGTIYRKGPDVLLKAYVETFTAKDDVCLVIKDFGGGSVYAGQTLEQRIRELQRHANAPEILYLNQDLPPHELPGLYTACDCLAHPYRGEGFGLPVLEAMACGLPVIVTAGGATDDFVPDEAGYKIPAKRQVFGREISGMPLVGDGWLLEPELDAVKGIMRQAFANRDEARAKGRFASDHARQNWTWNRTAHRLAELARECAAGQSAAGGLPASPATTQNRKPAPPLKITLPPVAKLGHLGAARELLQQRKLVPAWNAALAALAIRPFHPEAWLLLAEIAAQAGDAKRVKECVDRARELAPNWQAVQQFARSHSPRKPAGKVELPPLPPLAEPRLSVCLIAKNEERFLGQCLRSIKDIAGQIVVVDTGSTDRTVAIAKEQGAEVHHFTWCDDFSAARNAALEKATGDWVLVLDADEEVSRESISDLRQAMKAANTIGWRLPIVDAGKEAEGCTYVPRLFRNAPGLFYVSRVHEQVFSSVEVRREEWSMETGVGSAKLIHHGYTAEVLKDRNKVARNLRLLELAIEEIPGDPNLLMNCGLELIRSGRTDDGLQRYTEAFAALNDKPAAEITPELRESLLAQYTSHLMKFSRWQDIVAVLTSPVARREPLSASLCFTLGLAHQELHQWTGAAEQFRFCLDRRNAPSFYLVNPVILGGAPRHCLALALWQAGNIADAAREFATARREDPVLLPLQMDAARFEAAHGEPVAALKLFHGVVTTNPAVVDAWVRGAKVALSDPDFVEFARDWTVEAVKQHPENRELIAARGETLLLTQQFVDALPHWRRLNGHPRALAARILCELMQGEFSLDALPVSETEVSQEFLNWYRRLVAYRAAEGVSAIGERLAMLSTLLPSAARVLGQVLDQVAVEAA